jgi:acetoin utilization protein AcuB
MLVKSWMSKDVVTIEKSASMQDAIFLLKEHGINILPVISKNELVGIVTDRDLKSASPSEATTLDMHELLYLVSKIKVEDVMTRSVHTVLPDHTIEEAAALLLEKKISGLPVLDENRRLVGIITRTDLFRVIISLSGLGDRGIQIGVRVEDRPGSIKEIREVIREFEGRTSSILCSGEDVPPGYQNVYFRVYQIVRKDLPSLLEAIGEKGKLLYMVDHRNDTRKVYES